MPTNSLAFIFPGQGSQKIGMLQELAASFPIVEQTFAEASQSLGYDMWELVQHGQQEDINLTERTQPVLLTSSVAVWRVWQERQGPAPKLLAGHSLGEWSALVCAGVVDFTSAVKLVQMRGAFMQQAVPQGEGAMAAIIGVGDDVIREACASASSNGDELAVAVNYNAPSQVVIAGHAPAVERAINLLKQAGAKRAMPLPVSAPFHTPLMKPAAEHLGEYIHATEFRSPAIPIVHNVHGRTETDPEVIKELMIQQIDHPVLWVDCVRALVGAGITDVVECGPGKVLAGLARRIDKSLNAHGIEDPESLEKALAEL